MCFAPQQHALFEHLNFRKCSERGVLCTVWLRNVLRATTACTFQYLNFQKCSEPVNFLILLSSKCASHHHFFDIRTWGVFIFFTSKCASRHNGVQFFISHLARRLRTHRFSEPTFRPSGATNHWKTRWVATFLPFRAPASYFFWLFLFSDLLSSSLLFLTLPTSAFPSLHIVRSLTSKFPSIKMCIYIRIYSPYSITQKIHTIYI